MAQIIVNGQLGFFNLRSEWKCAYHPSGNGTYYIASGPTTASHDDSFIYAVPDGAIINSARITANWASPNTGFAVKTINGVTPNASNNYLVDVPVSVGTHTLTATFKFRANGRVYSDTATHSGTTAVSDIALIIDYTVPMSTWTLNKGSVEAGGSIAVSVTPAMAGCTHRVTWAFGSQSVVQSMAANVNSQTLSVPMAWCQQMPSATSARAAVTLETIMNGAVLGSETKYFTVTVPPSVVPTAGSLAIAGNNLTWGLYLQNRSTATVTASGYAGAQGSTITAVRIEGGGYAVDGATLTTGTFPSAGTVTFTLRVTDSRGRSATTTAQMTVTAYSTPSITATTEYRADADGSPNGTGTSIGCQVVYTWSEVGSNAAHIKIEYKPTAANAWITALNGSLASGTSQVIGDGNISLVSAWDVRYTLSDDLGSAVVTRKIPTGYVYMRWDPQQNALGFGCYPEGEKRIQVAEDWKLILGQTDVQTALIQRDRVRNLLDNSDFRNPVNQRGASSYTGNVYTIDRWALWWDDTTNGTLTINDDGITVTKWLFQNLENVDPDKEYTFAVSTANGLHVVSGKPSESATDGVISLIVNGYVQVNVNNPGKMYWAALYEGSYTADTLPTYVPKGYGAELAECRRYYRRNEFLNCAKTNGNYFSVSKSIEMRAVPTVTLLTFAPYGLPTITDMSGCAVTIAQSAAGVQRITYATLPTCSAYSAGGLSAHLSADL